MKRLFTILAIAIYSISVFAQQEQYSKVKVFANETQLLQLAQAGIDITEGILKKGAFLICDYSETELMKIQDLGLNYEILFEDVSKYYVERNVGLSTNVDDYKDAGDYDVPENFEFGSMSGHCTFDEAVAHMDNMTTLFPDLITAKETIGQSIEGREMWMVKISDNPGVNEDEPEVLYTSLHHAREPAGLMSNIFYMYYLLENYDNDDMIKTLVDNTEMYFVLVVNPDGFVYNQTTNPNGGGMWRKNRRNNGNGSYGVDPNRNYGYMWGYDNNGSSPNPDDETYRGTEPFSEPEIVVMRDFCENHEFIYALNYHTYSNLLLYPWGWSEEPCEDDATFYAHSVLLTQDNNYTYGAGSTTIYPTNGGSDDWMYGEQTTKNKIFAYTPELGGGDDGFWCPYDRIIPIAQENMIQNILAAALSGSYAHIEDLSPSIIGENEGYLSFDITRLGLKDGATFTVTIDPISDVILSTGDPKVYNSMEILESITDSISYTLLPFVPSGTILQFLMTFENGDYVLTDTLTKIFGEPIVIFEDDCNSLTNWSSPIWDVTTASYYSATGSITDSPYENYDDDQNNFITLNENIDLSNAGFAILNFWGKWEIEQGWDYVQLMISTNNSSSWTPLEGKYTVTGNGNQAQGEPLYDGFHNQWVREEVDLTDYIGSNVKFRFRLKSDSYVTEDGFYFDDFEISVIELNATGEIETLSNSEYSISDPIPNPANEFVGFILEYPEHAKDLKFDVYNSAGQVIFSELISNGQKNQIININTWNPGVYYYQLKGKGIKTNTKKLVVIH